MRTTGFLKKRQMKKVSDHVVARKRTKMKWGIIEYPELEGMHKEDQSPAPGTIYPQAD